MSQELTRILQILDNPYPTQELMNEILALLFVMDDLGLLAIQTLLLIPHRHKKKNDSWFTAFRHIEELTANTEEEPLGEFLVLIGNHLCTVDSQSNTNYQKLAIDSIDMYRKKKIIADELNDYADEIIKEHKPKWSQISGECSRAAYAVMAEHRTYMIQPIIEGAEERCMNVLSEKSANESKKNFFAKLIDKVKRFFTLKKRRDDTSHFFKMTSVDTKARMLFTKKNGRNNCALTARERRAGIKQ